MLPVTKKLFTRLYVYQEKIMEQKDKRVQILQEALNGIMVIKTYAWENQIEAKVNIFMHNLIML